MTQKRAGARRRRFQRSAPTQNIDLTLRDKAILEALNRYRFLSSDQILRVAGGSEQKVLRRLRLLFDHGYVDRPRAQIASIVFGNTPMIYALGRKGAGALPEQKDRPRQSELNQAATNYFINHAVETAEFFIRLEVAAARAPDTALIYQDEIAEISTKKKAPSWPVNFKWPRGGKLDVNITPDGLFGLQRKNKPPVYFFVEIDCGTEPIVRSSPRQSSILKKMLAYRTLHKEDGCKLPNFRILFVTTSAKRISAMIDAIPDGTPKGLFLFRQLDGVNANLVIQNWLDGGGAERKLTG